MFTLNDIKPLVLKEGAKAVLIKINTNDIDYDTSKLIANQIKKATKLPVVFIPDGVEVEVQYDEI